MLGVNITKKRKSKASSKYEEGSEEENAWEVDRIIACRFNDKKLRIEYEVKWKGADENGQPWENTWEGEEALEGCKQALNDFRAAQNENRVTADAAKVDLILNIGEQFRGHALQVVEFDTDEIGIFLSPDSKDDFKKLFKENKKALDKWEDELNESIQRQGREYGHLYVQNKEDFVGPPSSFEYITNYMAGEKHIDVNKSPVVGCECSITANTKRQVSLGCNSKSNCCPRAAGHRFAYNELGRVIVPPGTPIYECNSLCKCDESCVNRVVQKGTRRDYVIFRTTKGERGWGLRTIEPIPKGSFIMEYVGEVITSAEAARRGRIYDDEGLTYLFDLDFNAEKEGDLPVYTIDAKMKGNMSRFANHSCEPNMHIYGVWIENLDPDMPRLALFASRDIGRCEELTFDYNMRTLASKKTQETVEARGLFAGKPISDSDDSDSDNETAGPSVLADPILNQTRRCKCRARRCRKLLYNYLHEEKPQQ